MIEVLPNWHPILVHFTIGLLITSVLLHLARFVLPQRMRLGALTTARWTLWIGATFTVLTVAAGFYAFMTVDHDEASHLAMKDHRNWALATVAALIVLSALQSMKPNRVITSVFVAALIITAGLVTTTGYKGGELVYRHGLGVLALPAHDDHLHGGHDDD